MNVAISDDEWSKLETRINAFVKGEFHRLNRWVEALVRDHHAVADIVQNALVGFIQIVNHDPRILDEPNRARGVLYRIARNKSTDFFRWQKRHRTETLEIEPLAKQEEGSQPICEIREFIEGGMQRLNQREAYVVRAYYWEGMSDTDTALILEITPATLRKIRSRAVHKLCCYLHDSGRA